MQVEINNTSTVTLPLMGHVIIGNNDVCDVVLDYKTETPMKICSIVYDKSVCILEVFNDETLFINQLPIKHRAILHPGDTIKIGDNNLRIINENALPKACSTPFKMIKSKDHSHHMVTSVSGLRSFNYDTFGELAIVGNQSSYTHKVLNDDDIAFSVSFIDNHLTLLCQKDKHIYINGNRANYVMLKDGDYISTGQAKYCVESPGTSAFSKYSPSHPRNIQLSEEYFIDIKGKTGNGHKYNFLKKHLWSIILFTVLIIITIILVALKNQ